MYRALNVDLIASMQEIVDEVVFYYKADFDYDVCEIQEKTKQEKTYGRRTVFSVDRKE